MNVMPFDIPRASLLDREVVNAAFFHEGYWAPLAQSSMSVTDIFSAIFAHHPIWMKIALMMRNRVATWCGLHAPSASEILNPRFKRGYVVGDTIGVWPIFALTETELVAGRDDKHLNFRVSVLKLIHGDTPGVAISTVCNVHNRFGKLYLTFVIPFHRWGVQRLIFNAIRAGRL
jgi:hypothetical protein